MKEIRNREGKIIAREAGGILTPIAECHREEVLELQRLLDAGIRLTDDGTPIVDRDIILGAGWNSVEDYLAAVRKPRDGNGGPTDARDKPQGDGSSDPESPKNSGGGVTVNQDYADDYFAEDYVTADGADASPQE